MTAPDWDRIHRYANSAAKTAPLFWREDCASAAEFAIWQHRDRPVSHWWKIGRTAVIDEIRRLEGRSEGANKTGRHRYGVTLHSRDAGTYESDPWDGVHEDIHPSDEETIEQIAARYFPTDLRHQYIARALVAGVDKQTIAYALGVSPGRVSQLLNTLRKRAHLACPPALLERSNDDTSNGAATLNCG